MRVIVVLYFLLALSFGSFSQTAVPDYGVIPSEERNLTVCPFDKEADAVIFFDKAVAEHNDDRNLIVTHRFRMKVLKASGMSRGDIEIPYVSIEDYQTISDIKATVYNFDEGGTSHEKSVDPHSIFRQKMNSNWSMVKFAMPEVKVGSILEYTYVITSKTYYALKDWYFQSETPTMLSSFSVVILPSAEFAYQVHKRPDLPIVIKPDKTEGKILFEMTDLAGLRDEPYSDAQKDYLQRVEFQQSGYQGAFGDKQKYMTSWDELTRELITDNSFGREINKNLPDGDLMNKVKPMAPYEKMKTIYDFVQHSFTWDGMYSKYAVDGVKSVWEKRKGNTGDINLVLINMLKQAGLEAEPLLVSERDNGKVNASYPFLDQFNMVMAYVEIGNMKYILDGAGPYTPVDLIPPSVINTNAYIVSKKKGGMISLTPNDKMIKNMVSILSSLEEDGTMKGTATVYSYDYARLTRKRGWTRDKEKFKETYFTKYFNEIRVDSINVTNLENDSLPLEQNVAFELPSNKSGDYTLLNLNMFTGFEKNPFISDIRFTDVDYGSPQSYLIAEHIALPEDMRPETLPKNIRLIMPDTSIAISRIIDFSNNAISAQYKIQVNKSIFTPDEYPALKEFYRKMSDILGEQVVLRKKPKN